jgi:hypothetical protein
MAVFDKEAGARYMRELKEVGFESYSEEASRRAVAAEKARLKQRRRPTDWPLDALTLKPSGSVLPEDVCAPPEPELPAITFYQTEAANPGVVPVNPNLQIFRRSQFERELAERATQSFEWTADYVDVRLVEGMKVLMRTPDRIGPRGYGSAMPRPPLEYSDLLAQAQNKSLRKTMARLLRNFGPPNAEEKRRSDESLAWMIEFLGDVERRILIYVGSGALWKAANASISAKCRDLGVSRQTFYATRKQGLEIIACRLTSAGRVPL